MKRKSEKPSVKLSDERVLIAIIAYEEEPRIQEVIKRLPEDIWDNHNYHILLCDDNSKDNTIEKAEVTLSKLSNNYNIIRLKIHQGYGGVQKICYRYAIDHGFDFAVLVHGDGQYAPELALKFVDSWKRTKAEVVLGSRMIDYRSAKKGGMPLYKLIGNIILTKTQNFICKTDFSEFHTGYRGYAMSFLRKVPFELNSNDFHFDTEILIQSFHTQTKVDEFLIPTFYGDETSRVPGLRYAWNVFRTSVQYRLQQLGLLVSLKYPSSANQLYQDKTKYPNSSQSWTVEYLKKNANPNTTRLLDIGHSLGNVTNKYPNLVKESTGIGGPELDQQEWTYDISKYDIVLILDTIQDHSNPEDFLLNLRKKTEEITMPKMLISVQNIGLFLMRLSHLVGRFNYADRGILNINHKRLYSQKSFKKLLTETGYEIKSIRGIGIPFGALGDGLMFKIFSKISAILAILWPSLFAFQFVAEVKPRQTAYQLIKNFIK